MFVLTRVPRASVHSTFNTFLNLTEENVTWYLEVVYLRWTQFSGLVRVWRFSSLDVANKIWCNRQRFYFRLCPLWWSLLSQLIKTALKPLPNLNANMRKWIYYLPHSGWFIFPCFSAQRISFIFVFKYNSDQKIFICMKLLFYVAVPPVTIRPTFSGRKGRIDSFCSPPPLQTRNTLFQRIRIEYNRV